MSQISKQNDYASWLTSLHNIHDKFSAIELTALNTDLLSKTIKASEVNYIINDINNFINTYDFDVTILDPKNSGELIYIEDLNNINNTLENLDNICVNKVVNGTSTNGTTNSNRAVNGTTPKTVEHQNLYATTGDSKKLTVYNNTGHGNYDTF